MANEKRLNCPMRHENGNCLAAGGFCTAVNDPICEALHNAFKHGERAEYERLTLACVKENVKYEQEKLEVLREIYKKVTTPTVEVVHGRWEQAKYHGFLRCSECKDVYIYDAWVADGKWNYCPNCGAKMDKNENP